MQDAGWGACELGEAEPLAPLPEVGAGGCGRLLLMRPAGICLRVVSTWRCPHGDVLKGFVSEEWAQGVRPAESQQSQQAQRDGGVVQLSRLAELRASVVQTLGASRAPGTVAKYQRALGELARWLRRWLPTTVEQCSPDAVGAVVHG